MRLSSMQFNVAVVVLLSCFLAGCDGGQGDDLDQFMENAAVNMSMTVDPLPEVLPYTPLPYNADDTLVDPFKARQTKRGAGSLQPNTNRPKELMESFPLESLLYVGSMSKQGSKFALIKTPDGVLHQLRVGNYIGPNFGLINSIQDGAITIKEVVQDDFHGDWVERDASINLQE
ncbi:MAG: pilus assembly protein PilP [Methylophilaceae bacterium]|nr:MAG: pilus assembly protein PilP [Methylophilaceae bacterium]